MAPHLYSSRTIVVRGRKVNSRRTAGPEVITSGHNCFLYPRGEIDNTEVWRVATTHTHTYHDSVIGSA